MSRVNCCLSVVVVLTPCLMSQTNTLTRDRDPVVMVGADLPTLMGLDPNSVVAFCYRGGWQQIPVQIDQRKMVDFTVVYGGGPCGFTTSAYVDPNTYTGPDDIEAFDSDDELVFMARDAGDRAGSGSGIPAGILPGSGVKVEVTDSLDGGSGYVYLFQTDGALVPGAGKSYVSYAFNLLSGSYIPNYNTYTGPNPENSEVITPYYRTHFSDRWICDQLNVYAGGATGVDILDRNKIRSGPGECGRTEQTFSVGADNFPGEGAFFTNKVGPVRAIRSYMGANSGIVTQGQHLFYEQRQDVTTFFRVHCCIPGALEYYDYSPQATGMSYYNDLNLQGVVIDGNPYPDTLTGGPIVWEMVTGAQGSLLISHLLETDISPFSYTFFYSDAISPVYSPCTGDAWEYGASGVWVTTAIPNTDPILAGQYGYMNHLTLGRILYYEPPGQTVQTAELRYSQASAPLGIQASAYYPTHTLSLTTVNPSWGQVLLSPEPNDANDPNLLAYPVGTTLTLTAAPIEGKSFREWTIWADPNRYPDPNCVVVDSNMVLHLTMDHDYTVEAAFKCGSGMGGALPLLVIGTVALGFISRRVWQRG